MELAQITAGQVVMLFLLMGTGIAAVKTGVLKPEGKRTLSNLLVYLVVRQTMPDIIPLLQSGDEEALEAYLSRDMSFTGILYMALLQMVQVWSIVISGVIVTGSPLCSLSNANSAVMIFVVLAMLRSCVSLRDASTRPLSASIRT